MIYKTLLSCYKELQLLSYALESFHNYIVASNSTNLYKKVT